MKRVIFAAVLAWLTAVSGAYAQTGVVTNPRELEFESPDHEKFAADGTTPLVLRYDVCWRFVGAATCFTTTDLGKPAALAAAEATNDEGGQVDDGDDDQPDRVQ